METVDKLLPSISGMFEYRPIKEQAKQDPDLELDLELNLVQVIEQMRKTGPVPPDLRVDDRDIKEHPNFYSWCFGSEGVGVSPFSRQMAIASTLLAEVCPNRRCTKRQFWNLENIPVDYNARDFPDKITFLEYGRCPKCGARKSELYRDKRLNIYQELCGIAGQRSGKSALVALLIPYLLHKWLKLQKPTEALGLMPNSILTFTLVALTFNKAISLLWSPMINSLLNAPFFQRYHECLDYYGEKHGIELYRVKDTFLNYNYKNIFVSPSGPNKRTLRGESRLGSVIDELAWFPPEDHLERASGTEVYVSLDRSLKTVRKSVLNRILQGQDNLPMAMGLNISSPSSYGDKMMQLARQHTGSREVYVYHLPTWEINPLYTKEDFNKEYREDPVKAERDFGANPPASECPYVSDPYVIERSMVSPYKIKYRYKHGTSPSGQRYRYGQVIHAKMPISCPRTVLSIDAGYSNNSFALSIIHPTNNGSRVLGLIEISPRLGHNVLNYTYIYRYIICPLIEQCNVGLVACDRWQSIKILQDIEDQFGIYTVQRTLKVDDFDLVLDYFLDEDQLIDLPKPEIGIKQIEQLDIDDYPRCFKYIPSAHLYWQFLTVIVDKRGCPNKGVGYTDDILRSLCLGLSFTLCPEDIEQYELYGEVKNTPICVGTKISGQAVPNIGVRKSETGGSSTNSNIGVRS